MNSINREQFEAWLFSQPDNRTFNYQNIEPEMDGGCLICAFFKENTNATNIRVGGHDYNVNGVFNIPIPEWIRGILSYEFLGSRGSIISFKDTKAQYLKLFPNAIVGNTQPSAIAEKVENVSIAQVTSGNLANAEFAAQTIK